VNLLAPALALATGLAGAPPLRVTLAPARARQGSVVQVAVASPGSPLARADLVDGERRIPLERRDGGELFVGLVGVDFESAPGERPLLVEGTDGAGAPVTARVTLRVLRRKFAVSKLSVDPRFVEPPAEERERIERDRQAFRRAFASPLPERLWKGPFSMPAGGFSQRNFGARRVYNGQTRSRHAGLDISAPAGTPVAAPASGVVVLAGDFYFSGGSVVLDHGGGLLTMYFHLSRIDVKEGDRVAPGERIGAVGATGRVTGPHLHWAARLGAARVDPSALLSLEILPAAPATGASRD
jgi:murein DD-endopeptidase MepM/ murein hydrolase activator NlpD